MPPASNAGLLPRVLGLEAELHSMRDKHMRLEMECKILHDHIRELEDGRRETRGLMEEMRREIASLRKRQNSADGSPVSTAVGSGAKPQQKQKPLQGKVEFRERESILEIDNIITGQQAAKLHNGGDVEGRSGGGSGRSVKTRVPTAFARPASNGAGDPAAVVTFAPGDDESPDEEAIPEGVSAVGQQKRNVKGRTPTGFVRAAPVVEEEGEEEGGGPGGHVSFDPSVDAGGGGRGGKPRRVPTAFVHRRPGDEEDEEEEEEDEGHVRFTQQAKQLGERSTAKRRVPTAFVKGAPAEDEEDEEDEEGRTVTFDPSASAAGQGRPGAKKRVPTAFVRAPADEEDEDDDAEGGGEGGDDGARRVRIETTGAGHRNTAKQRVPTAFVRRGKAELDDDDEDGEDAEGSRAVSFAPGATAAEGKTKKKMRVPTAFVANAPAPDDDEDEDDAEGSRSVTFEAGAAPNEGKTKKKMRVPTAFVVNAPAPDDEDEDDAEGSRSVTFEAGTASNEGKAKKKMRVPTDFVVNAPAPDDDEDEDDAEGSRSVTFEAGTASNEGKAKKKMRVPIAFVVNAPTPDDDEDEDEAEGSRSVTFEAETASNEGKAKKKMRVPTAFVVNAPAPDDDEDEDDAEGSRSVTFEAGADANEGKTKRKMRVPTAFVAHAPEPDDEDEDDEGGNRSVTFEAGAAANEGKTKKKMRVPTAFVVNAPEPDDDDEDEEEAQGSRSVTFEAGATANEGKSKKKMRVPTAFVARALEPDEEEEDGESGGKSVSFEAGTALNEGKTKRKMRVPTAFVAGGPTPDDDDDEEPEEGWEERSPGKSVSFAAGVGEGGGTKKKVRVPTAFVQGGPVIEEDDEDDDEDEEDGEEADGARQNSTREPRAVKFRSRNSEFEYDELASERAESETKRAIKRRVPTSFAPSTDEDEDDQDDEGFVRFNDEVDDNTDDDLLDLRQCRPARGRIPTAFVRKPNGVVPPEGDSSDHQSSSASPGRRERRERMPTALGRRTSEEFSDVAVSRTVSEAEGFGMSFSEKPEFDPELHRVPGARKNSELIAQSLKSLHFFHDLSDQACNRLAEEMSVFDLPNGTMIAQQGSTRGTHFFVVDDGTFEVNRDGKRVALVSRGGLLGESVILLSGAQNATVCAKGKARAYAMTGLRARMIFQEQYQHGHKDVIDALNEVLRSSLDRCSLLRNLTQYQEHMLYDGAKTQNFAAGQHLQVEGRTDITDAYVLLRGTLDITGLPDGKTKQIDPIGLVGDLSILYGSCPHTVVCAGPVKALVLSKRLLTKMFGDKLSERLLRSRICDALTQHETFAALGTEQLEAAASFGDVIQVAPGESLSKEKLNFMLGLVGTFEATALDAAGEAPPVTICASLSDTIGQERLMKGMGPWTLSFTNNSKSTVRCIVWEDAKLDAILSLGIIKRGDSIWSPPEIDPTTGQRVARNTRIVRSPSMRIAVLHDDKVGALKKVFYLKTLSSDQLQLLADTLIVEYAGAGEVIFEQGSEGDEFFIIHSGLLEVSIGEKRIRTLGVGDYVGERALLLSEPRSATVTAKEDSELWKISSTAFKNCIKGPILEYMKDRISFQDTKVEIDSLKCLRVVGRGGFGVVKMVRSTKTSTRYALKCVSIQQAVDTKQQKNLVAERSILAELDHPFVIKFIRTFKSKQYVYFLMELVTGGELLDALQFLGLLTRPQAQFYVGSLVLALEFLHERRIAYLDLKGENCLIDAHGYLKIIDFGVAERVVDGKIFMTRGTCYYMAPEVILPVQGYTTTADLWSLGVVTFDFMTGEFPFANEITDPRHAQANNQILSEILNKSKKPLRFPNPKVLDKATKTFIQGLLQANPQKRLGAGLEGYDAIKNHPFFAGFSWDGLLARQIEPPYKPTSEVYAEDSAAPENSSSEELQVVEDAMDKAGSVQEVGDDPDKSWLEEF